MRLDPSQRRTHDPEATGAVLLGEAADRQTGLGGSASLAPGGAAIGD